MHFRVGTPIRRNDAGLFAKQFISLCEAGPYQEVLLGASIELKPAAQTKKLAAFAVETFIRTHTVDGG